MNEIVDFLSALYISGKLEVKTNKHRENYLGHSLFAPVGRQWYSKDGKNEQAYNDEIKTIKDAEADAMAEFL
ncbi:hypothetical protein C2G38_2157121 [Gigaspora rosea]|uniref:Multiple myeloma tumor-associated protein 2-like N-terminal domain-containing protein n=1 Tax=Gigaspora rosea TaxID=44941 RepID=A0A397W221_9GLOM|nr:hypothetical protein C2G38_2157121 [Gigaspora rosea]